MMREYGLARMRAGFAVGLLAATFLAGAAVSLPVPALAQGAARHFAIPPQSLDGAMAAFSRATRIQVLTRGATTRGVRSPGASGNLTPQQALQGILAGTGLVAQFAGGNTVTVIDPRQGAESGGVPVDGDVVQLETIDVTSSGTARRAADRPYETPGSGAYISNEQIERFGVATAGDIFKSTSGVMASGNHSGGASVDVNIRGMQGQSRVKVAIDGTQQSSTTWRGYLGVDERVYIDPDLIGGVSIEKGPTGGAEGAGTTGGVVSVRTLNAEDIVREGESYGFRVKASTGDNAISPPPSGAYVQRTDAPDFFDFENGSVSVAGGVVTENFDFVAAVARRKTGNYFAGERNPNALDGKRPNTGPGEEVFNTSEDSFSALAKATLRFGDDHTLKVGYTRFESNFGEAMGTLLFNNPNYYRQIGLSKVETDTFTANYRYAPQSDLIDFRANAWATRVDQNTRIAQSVPPDLARYGFIPADDPRLSEVWTYGADASNTSRVNTAFGDLVFNYGASYQLEDADGDPFCSRGFTRDRCALTDTGHLLTPSIGTREIGSLFSTAEWRPTNWLKFNAGLRYDTYRLKDKGPDAIAGWDERDGARLNPSVSVTVEPVDGFQLFALYAEGVRPPTLRETMGSDGNTVPNPDLDPEVQKNWEFGANVLKDGVLAEGDLMRLKASYFVNTSRNYISRVDRIAAPGEYLFTFANLDRVMFAGVELSAQYDGGFFFSEAALTRYTDYEFCPDESVCGSTVQSDCAVNHSPPELYFTTTVGMRLLDRKLEVGTRVIHATDRLLPVTASVDRQRAADWTPYTVLDVFASYKFNEHVTLDIKAENLTDLYYIDAMDGWMPAPGRTIRAGLTARF